MTDATRFPTWLRKLTHVRIHGPPPLSAAIGRKLGRGPKKTSVDGACRPSLAARRRTAVTRRRGIPIRVLTRPLSRGRYGQRKRLVREIERKLAEDGARPIIFYRRRVTCIVAARQVEFELW